MKPSQSGPWNFYIDHEFLTYIQCVDVSDKGSEIGLNGIKDPGVLPRMKGSVMVTVYSICFFGMLPRRQTRWRCEVYKGDEQNTLSIFKNYAVKWHQQGYRELTKTQWDVCYNGVSIRNRENWNDWGISDSLCWSVMIRMKWYIQVTADFGGQRISIPESSASIWKGRER